MARRTSLTGPFAATRKRLRGRLAPVPGEAADLGSEEVERPLSVVVVDDHEVLRAGTRQVLETAGDLTVVGEAGSWDDALEVVGRLRPDIALIDVRLPGRNGIDLARRLLSDQPGTRVVMLSAYDDVEFVRRALEAGVSGYLLKTLERDELINAVRAVGNGTTVLDPAVSSRLSATPPATESGVRPPPFTQREQEVVALVADGLSNKAIAARLGVSTRTVEGHINHIFTKLGVESRTELVRFVLTNPSP
jgi:DNA-binding NarL/FixJ family response regulator